MRSFKGDSIHVPTLLRNRRKEARRIEFCAQQINQHLKESVYNFPSLKSPATHQFYIDSIRQITEIGALRKKLGALDKSTEIIWRINKEHVSEIWNVTNVRVIKKIRRKAFARFSSVVSAHKGRLELLERIRRECRRLPDFDFDQPIICLAGYPNAGKSTFLSSITNAKPQIGAFPFTTKEIIVGKYETTINDSTAEEQFIFLSSQVVDTPGLLDRPADEKNDIEKRALTALKTLPDILLYLFDPLDNNTFESQINLYKELKSFLRSSCNSYLAINKSDLLESKKLEEIENWIHNKVEFDPFTISANNPNDTGRILDSILYKAKFYQLSS
ncbi:MAG: GTPase [Candidatus Hodarchaeales archaeon]